MKDKRDLWVLGLWADVWTKVYGDNAPPPDRRLPKSFVSKQDAEYFAHAVNYMLHMTFFRVYLLTAKQQADEERDYNGSDYSGGGGYDPDYPPLSQFDGKEWKK